MKAYISAKNNINVIEVLQQLAEDINTLPQDVEDFAYKIFYSKDIQTFIVEANRKLLEQGLRPDLTPIEKIPEGNQKSNFYERLTQYNREKGKSGYKEGTQSEFVDLYKTGFFYKSLTVRSGSNELLEFSTDPKSEELEKVWGNVLGISSEDLNKLIMKLRPQIVKFVKDKLKLQK